MGITSPNFVKRAAGAYSVYGGELSSKFSYEINYKKVSSSEITIDFVFTAPDKGFSCSNRVCRSQQGWPVKYSEEL